MRCGVPAVCERKEVRDTHAVWIHGRQRQSIGVGRSAWLDLAPAPTSEIASFLAARILMVPFDGQLGGPTQMKAKLGIAPIAWWNDDLPELSDDVSLEECLRQAREAGFTGMETGPTFSAGSGRAWPHPRQARHQRLRRLVLRPAARWRYREGEGSHSPRRWLSSRRSARPASSMARPQARSRAIATHRSPRSGGCRRMRSRPMAAR